MTTPARRALLWGPVVAYMAVIFGLSAQSSPPVPGGLPDWVLHGIEYFGFAIVVFRAVSGGVPAALSLARVGTTMAIVTAYAVSDELHQLYVPHRTADIRDVRADVVGASIALLVCWAWHIIATPNARRPKPRADKPKA